MSKKITRLDELAPKTQDYTITNSVDGEELVLTMRDLLPDELAAINARLRKPTPPVIGFEAHKDAQGRPIPKYDEDDPKYRELNAVYNNDYVRLWLLQSLEIEYPADCTTEEEKLAALKKSIPQWAFRELRMRLEEINGLRDSDVAFEKKRSRMTPSDTLKLPVD